MSGILSFFHGVGIAYSVARFGIIILLCLWAIRRLILTRIGSFRAIHVVSYARLVLAVVVCNGINFACYESALLLKPSEGWIRFTLFAVATFGLKSLLGSAVTTSGFWLDGGLALRVITDRYKPPGLEGLVDLTDEQGTYAQLVPRGAIISYWLFLPTALLATAIVMISRLLHSG